MTPAEESALAAQVTDAKAAIVGVHLRIDRHYDHHEKKLDEISGRLTGLEKRYAELKGISIACLALVIPFALERLL